MSHRALRLTIDARNLRTVAHDFNFVTQLIKELKHSSSAHFDQFNDWFLATAEIPEVELSADTIVDVHSVGVHVASIVSNVVDNFVDFLCAGDGGNTILNTLNWLVTTQQIIEIYVETISSTTCIIGALE